MQTPDRNTNSTIPQRDRVSAPQRRNAGRESATAVHQPAGKPKSFYVAVIVAILALLAALVLAFALFSNNSAGRDPNAAVGQLENKTPEEIQAELDRIVEEGMFNISIASMVQLEDGASEAELRIENVPNNPYLMKVELNRDDTGETIYTSGMIEPNHHIQKAKLDVDLDAGEYPCTAVFYAYDKQSEELVGQAAAKLTVLVQN